MKSLFLVLFGLVLLTIPLAGAREIPDLLYGNEGEAGYPSPIWVSADRALTPEGHFDPDLFSESNQRDLEYFRTKALKTDCLPLAELTSDERIVNNDRGPTLEDAVRNTERVFTARVRATAVGFRGREPGTLLKIQPIEMLKGSRAQLDDRFVFIPVGEIHLGGIKLCKTHPRYADLPEVGDEVLLFVSSWFESGEILGTYDETGIVTIHNDKAKDKAVSLPLRYRNDTKKAAAPRTKTELIQTIRRATLGSKRRWDMRQHGINEADGSNSRLVLYESTNLTGLGIVACHTSRAMVADSIAHELGHFLGLDDTGGPGCTGNIMSGRRVSSTGLWDTSREVKLEECTAADSQNSTTAEQVQEAGGAPLPPRPTQTSPGSPPGSPILIDLAGDSFALTSLAQGVRFDIDADGHEEQVSWTSRSSEDMFLALDRNGNGWIDDGRELFGDVTAQPPSQTPNGYRALAVFDDNQDGRITTADQIYDDLRLWTDANHDGRSQAGELSTLRAEGVSAIYVVYLESWLRDRYGNEFRYWSLVERSGRRLPVLSADVFFRVRE